MGKLLKNLSKIFKSTVFFKKEGKLLFLLLIATSLPFALLFSPLFNTQNVQVQRTAENQNEDVIFTTADVQPVPGSQFTNGVPQGTTYKCGVLNSKSAIFSVNANTDNGYSFYKYCDTYNGYYAYCSSYPGDVGVGCYYNNTGSSGSGGGSSSPCSSIGGYNANSMGCYDYPGGDLQGQPEAKSSPAACQTACSNNSNCVAWTWVKSTGMCWQKGPAYSCPSASSCNAGDCVSGAKGGNSCIPGGGGTNPTPTTAPGSSTAPSQPSSISATSGPCTNGVPSIAFTWSPSSGATGYWLNVSTDPNFGGWGQYKTSSSGYVWSNGSPLIGGGVPESGVTYYYRVVAYGGDGSDNSLYSQPAGPQSITAKTCTAPTVTTTPSDTPVPTTETPTSTQAPTATVTSTPVPPTATATTAPNQPTATSTTTPDNPTATPTTPAGSTNIAFVLILPGIGGNVAGGQITSPVKTTREASAQLIDTSGNIVTEQTITTTFTPSTFTFDGLLSANAPSGPYRLRVKLDNSLWKAINVNAVKDQTVHIPGTTLITGDLNQDNRLDLVDYNAFLSCYGSKSCSQKQQADLNMDGSVEEKDLNLLYEAFKTRLGD